MKTLLTTYVSILFLLSGCATNKPLNINAEFISVIKEDDNREFLVTDNEFQDRNILINSRFYDNQIVLELTNFSNRKTLIHWNESALIGTDGTTHKIYFATVEDLINYMHQKPSSNPAPTILAAGSKIIGGVYNSENGVYYPASYSSGYVVHTSKYRSTYMPGTMQPASYVNYGIILRNSSLSREDDAQQYLGKFIKLVLAIENGGKKRDYTMLFKVNNVNDLKGK